MKSFYLSNIELGPNGITTLYGWMHYLDIQEPPSVDLDKRKEVIGGDIPVSAKATQKLPLTRRSPICHHCGLRGHIRPKYSLLKGQRSKVEKELPRQATFGTRPLAWHQASQYQDPPH
jgi:hypothetical protein